MKLCLYAAYGSNMNMTQMTSLCKNAYLAGTGFILRKKLVFSGYGNHYCNIEDAGNKNKVPVAFGWYQSLIL